MIEPTQSASFPAASAPSVGASAPVKAVAPVASRAESGEGAAPRPALVSLSVDRDASGVFVYTLTDSATGRVLAVIPRSVAVSASQPEVDFKA